MRFENFLAARWLQRKNLACFFTIWHLDTFHFPSLSNCKC